MAKWVYMFTEGNATMRNLLGGKSCGDDEFGTAGTTRLYRDNGSLHTVL